MMGRDSHDPTSFHSSIALLQERFRQLQRVKEMREERELQKMLNEPKQFSSNTTTSMSRTYHKNFNTTSSTFSYLHQNLPLSRQRFKLPFIDMMDDNMLALRRRTQTDVQAKTLLVTAALKIYIEKRRRHYLGALNKNNIYHM